MGGKEGSRGYLYQAFASVLEALTDKCNWDKRYIEFPISNDKVDIALEKQNLKRRIELLYSNISSLFN